MEHAEKQLSIPPLRNSATLARRSDMPVMHCISSGTQGSHKLDGKAGESRSCAQPMCNSLITTPYAIQNWAWRGCLKGDICHCPFQHRIWLLTLVCLEQTRLQAAVKGNYGIKQPVPFDMHLQRAGMKSAIYDSMPRQAYEFKISCSKLPRRAQVKLA